MNGRSPVCVRLWIVRLPTTLNVLLHPGKSHLYGRSCVCVRICCVSVLASLKRLWHEGHSYGRSPVCVWMCRSTFCFCVNLRPCIARSQPTQPHSYSVFPEPTCTCAMCAVNSACVSKLHEQLIQPQGCRFRCPSWAGGQKHAVAMSSSAFSSSPNIHCPRTAWLHHAAVSVSVSVSVPVSVLGSSSRSAGAMVVMHVSFSFSRELPSGIGVDKYSWSSLVS